MKISAAVVTPDGSPFRIETVELDAPRDDEILVRIAAVGICHTDIAAQHGGFGFDRPAVLGHEGAGVVEAVGKAVRRVAVGDRVALSFRSCGHCPTCDSHHPAYCQTMPHLNFIGMRPDGSRSIRQDGSELASNFFGQSSFATHALTYETNVVRIPDDIPSEIAAPMGCGIQTGAGSVINVFKCPPGSSILVAGGGAVGLSAVMAAKIEGCATIILIEPHAVRRALALDVGATHVIDPTATEDLPAAIRAIVPAGVDFALDTTGRQEVLEAIMASLAVMGRLGCVAMAAPSDGLPGNLSKLMMSGQGVQGIIEGDSDPATFLPLLMDHYRAGRMPLDRLTKVYPFASINEAIADQHAGRCVKAVLTFA